MIWSTRYLVIEKLGYVHVKTIPVFKEVHDFLQKIKKKKKLECNF